MSPFWSLMRGMRAAVSLRRKMKGPRRPTWDVSFETLAELFHYDRLYIGGGNARAIRFRPGPQVTIISNEAGIRGGIALWQRPR